MQLLMSVRQTRGYIIDPQSRFSAQKCFGLELPNGVAAFRDLQEHAVSYLTGWLIFECFRISGAKVCFWEFKRNVEVPDGARLELGRRNNFGVSGRTVGELNGVDVSGA